MNAGEIMDVETVMMFAIILGAVSNVLVNVCQTQNFHWTDAAVKMLVDVPTIMETARTLAFQL